MADIKHRKIAPFEIRRNKEFGRYLVASRDLEHLQVVIEEEPSVCGPADDDQDMELGDIPMCLGCFTRMTDNPFSKCSKCGWPVCGEKCEQMSIHSSNECILFTEKNVSYPPPHTWPIINKSILVLRCFLLKEKKPSEWEQVIVPLEHHTEIRHKKPYCVKGDDMLLENLEYFGYQSQENQTSSETAKLIIQLSGKININAFSSSNLQSSSNQIQTMVAQCIFPTASLLAHSCVPNCTWRIGSSPPNLEIVIRTSVPIKQGEMITIAYSSHDNIYGTLQRQISNEDVAHFICSCPRCKDKSELGTFISALKCSACEENYLLPRNPLNPDSLWECQECTETQTVQKVVRKVYEIQRKYEMILSQVYSREDEVQKLECLIESSIIKTLHPNHYILQEIRMRIIKKQLSIVSQIVDLTDTEIENVINHSKVLLKIADVLTPGFSQLRSLLQHFLAQGLLRKLKTEAQEGQDSYKLIYSLQSRALMFFKSHSNSQSQNLIHSIQRQLQDIHKFIV